MALYGTYYRGEWSDVVDVSDGGFQYGGVSYSWDDVESLDLHEWARTAQVIAFVLTLGFWWPTSWARVLLKDGAVLGLYSSRLHKKTDGGSATDQANPAAAGEMVFDELTSFIISKQRWRGGKR